MPVSKKRRRKNGKKVGSGGARIKVDPNKETHVTMQDLIDVLAYQEYVDAGVITPETRAAAKVKDISQTSQAAEYWGKVAFGEASEIAPNVFITEQTEINTPDEVPVNITDADGNKIGVGYAAPIEGDPDHFSINITDPRVMTLMQGPVEGYSIDKEQ